MDVVRLARWMACELYLREIESLRFELSMNTASDELLRLADRIQRLDEEQNDPRDQEASRGQLGGGA